MWKTLLLFIKLFSYLIGYVNCGDPKVTPLGDIIGPMGPTIVEKPGNKPEDDAATIKKAFDDVKWQPIADLIGQRTLAQRMAIDVAYQKISKDNQNISTSMAKSMMASGENEQLPEFYKGVFLDLPAYLASCIYNSLNNFPHWTHLSIICVSSETKLKAIVDAYFKVYAIHLSDDINKYVSDDGKDILKMMIDPKTMRPDKGTDDKLIDKQVALIPTNKDACNSKDLLSFMTSTSFEQIKNVVNKWFENNKNADIVDTFKKNCDKGYPQEAYKRIVRFAKDPYQYFSEELRLGIKCQLNNKRADYYILTSRSEIDLKDIIDRYNKDNNKDLVKDVQGWGNKNAYEGLYTALLVLLVLLVYCSN